MKVGTDMNAIAPAAEPVTLDPVYLLRDEIAQSYPPANGFERMLVLAAAQAWLRYQEALNFERRVYEKTDPLELFSQSIDKFKTVLRYVAECERAWRRSLAELRSTIRARARQTLASPYAPHAASRRPPSDLQNEPNPALPAGAISCGVQNEPNSATPGFGPVPEAKPPELPNEPNHNPGSLCQTSGPPAGR